MSGGRGSGSPWEAGLRSVCLSVSCHPRDGPGQCVECVLEGGAHLEDIRVKEARAAHLPEQMAVGVAATRGGSAVPGPAAAGVCTSPVSPC